MSIDRARLPTVLLRVCWRPSKVLHQAQLIQHVNLSGPVIQAKADVFFYIESFYNRCRRHSALDYLNPEAYEQLYYQRLELA